MGSGIEGLLLSFNFTRPQRMTELNNPAYAKSRSLAENSQITDIAWKVQNRLHKRYMKLMAADKDQRKTMAAIGRELVGFIWAIAIQAESACTRQLAA